MPGPHGATPEVVGNKAMGLIRMVAAGLPIPPGFVLPTTLCLRYLQGGNQLPEGTTQLLGEGIKEVEKATGLSFGGDRHPLLVSVRSGAAVSMPGMLNTLLNVGLCERTLPALIRMTGNPHQAWDSYRRLVQSFAEVVCGLPPEPFRQALAEQLRSEAVPTAAELDVSALKCLTRKFLGIYESLAGEPFQQSPLSQLTGAVEAVFRSWESPCAVQYRRLYDLNGLMGTAATIQAMVFGNMGGTSGSGVAFTRDPATGENTLYLDFIPNAQGEDVVSGRCPVESSFSLRPATSELYLKLRRIGRQLEILFRDAQDFEFTVQEDRLFLLQSRDAKRTPWAALQIACDLVKEGLIDEKTALDRLTGYDLHSIRRVRVATSEQCQPIGQGIPASPGVAVGGIVFDPGRGVELASAGRHPILVRTDISTDDIAGLAASAGILTARGGRTSHAAVVARQLNRPCIVSCRDLLVLDDGRSCCIGDRLFSEGEILSLDGNFGRVYAGKLQVVIEEPTHYLREVETWKAACERSPLRLPDEADYSKE
jgi:pyruvate,orthophosphate dikinase